MEFLFILCLVYLAAAVQDGRTGARDYDTRDYYVLELEPATSPDLIAEHIGLVYERALCDALDQHYLFSKDHRDSDRTLTDLQSVSKKRGDKASNILDKVKSFQKQMPRQAWEKRAPPRPLISGPSLDLRRGQDTKLVERQTSLMTDLKISDPIFRDQWHLFNTVHRGKDINVTGVWTQGITGKNVTVAIVDDGLDFNSEDLKPNYYAQGSYDFSDHREEPTPLTSEDKHGTRCAGEIGAARNDICGIGVAYDAKIAGLRILGKRLATDADDAMAMTYDYQHNDIYSCSWGPTDDGRTMEGPGSLTSKAMAKGVQKGRGGLGSIFVFATGNGNARQDNCNFDGFANSIYTIAIGAIDQTDQHSPYSEHCSAQLAVTYSSGSSGGGIYTTDVGQNQCFSSHGGTSAAAPLASATYALALSVRPDLSWRDIQWLQVNTAVPINTDAGGWQDTAAGKKFSHVFGYGKIDAYAFVEAAKQWKNVQPQARYQSPLVEVNQDIPQGEAGLPSAYTVTAGMLQEAKLQYLEHVTATITIHHTRRGDLSVDLISPHGVVSHIATSRNLDTERTGYRNWTFMTVAHWGESGIGTWTVIAKDTEDNEHKGNFAAFQLTLWGEAIDAKEATLSPAPPENEGNGQIGTIIATPTSTVTSSSGPPIATGTNSLVSSIQSDWLSLTESSTRRQAWAYSGLLLILILGTGASVQIFLNGKKKERNTYEFERIGDNDDDR